MKNIFAKKNLRPIIVLCSIAVIVAVLLGGVNYFTSKKIERQRLEAANAGKIEVLPGLDVTTLEEITPDGKYPAEIKAISKFDIGYVFESRVSGNAAGMIVLVGVNNDGNVTGVKVLENNETPSFWANVVGVLTGENGKYNGKNGEDVSPEIVSGATNSSTGIYNAVKASLDAFVVAGGGEITPEPGYEAPVSQRTDAELLTLAGELVEGAAGFTAVEYDAEANDLKYVAKVLKENGGKGYVAYVVVMSKSYAGAVESEALVHIEYNGKIKAVKKLACNISPANPTYGYYPPTEEEVNAFYDRLPTNSSSTIGDVELVTNATNTSTNVVNSVKEALTLVSGIILRDMPTPEAQVKSLAAQLLGGTADLTDVTPDKVTHIRKLYRDNGGKGYIAYVVVINDRYARVETETLLHIDITGKIVNILKMTWKTSDAGWGYVPPEDGVVNPFYESLKGKTVSDIEALIALEENTDGLLVTGATNTSKALLGSIAEAQAAVVSAAKLDLPTSESQLKALIGEMLGGEANLTEIAPADATYLRKLYRDNGGNGYFAYVVVINERYARVETETLLHIDTAGKILNIKKLTWKTSDAGWGYVPPEESAVNPFYESLKGKTVSDIAALIALESNADGLLVTGATSTSKALLGSIAEAQAAVVLAVKNDTPTSESELKALIGEMLGGEANLTDITPKDSTYLRKLYRDNGGKGYFAYLVVMNERYGRVETETILHIDSYGNVKTVKKLIWKTSDAGWGYEPPAESLADAFYESLGGKTLSEIEALIALESNADGLLVTGATSTSKALLGSVAEALRAARPVIKDTLPTPEDEVKSLALGMLKEGSTLTDITPDEVKFLKRLYRVNGANEYVAYLVVYNDRYGRVETESLIYINDRSCIADIKKMTWKTSDAGWGYEPPAESLADAFYESLKGKTLSDVESLIALEENTDGLLVTGATSTSKALLGSVAEAFGTAKALDVEIPNAAPRAVGIIIFALAILAFAAETILKRRRNH